MNRILKGLLVTALAMSAAQVSAYTNKNFMMPRPVGVDLPMMATSFNELAHHKGADRFGGTFAATGFYKGSANGSEAAKYFLFKDKSTVNLAKGAVRSDATVGTVDDLDLGYIVHNMLNDVLAYSGTVNLDPEQIAYGVRFDYHQCLGKILKGLYLYANLPVAHVENNLKLKVASSTNVTAAVFNAAAQPVKATLEQYFAGTFENTTIAANAQGKLTKAKINGKRSATGVADIDLGLGYKFLNKETYHAALALAVTIPTGNEANGEYAFEPIYGNGKHFGLGGDLCAGARVWGDMDHNIKLNLTMKYRYLFESKEKRTLGQKNRDFGQYRLLISAKAAAGQNPFVPMANISTLDVDVTPGSQFDGVLGLAYNNGGFNFDLGYNMYFREAESLKLKGAFTDGTYAIAARNANATAGAAVVVSAALDDVTDGGTANGAGSVLSKTNFDLDQASTPSQFTNGIYSGLGYSFKEWDTPVMLGLGGKYEWASKNSAVDQWTVYGKLGIGF